MSGGSFDYMYWRIQEMYGNRLEDKELNELLDDFCEILRELEWWQSCDTGEEDYRKAVKQFKKKWLSGYDKKTNGRIDRFKKNLKKSIEEQLSQI